MIDFMIGRRYSFRGFNCWDYAVKLREQAGIDTPLFKPKNLTAAYDTIKTEMKKVDHGLKKVSEPRDFDILIGSQRYKGKKIFHCGVWYNNQVLHCSLSAKQVRKQSYLEFMREYEAVTIWR